MAGFSFLTRLRLAEQESPSKQNRTCQTVAKLVLCLGGMLRRAKTGISFQLGFSFAT